MRDAHSQTMSEPQQATHSLRRRLLLGILVPVIAFISFNTYSLYHQTLASLHTAYDRTLLASAKSISEQLDVEGYDDEAQIRAIVPYSALATGCSSTATRTGWSRKTSS